MLELANPAGLYALLAIPSLILIYFLQLKRRKIPTSTLFLLNAIRPPSKSGKRFHRLLTDKTFWWLNLTLIFLTLALSRPFLPKSANRHFIALVLDNSASMSAFLNEIQTKLPKQLEKFCPPNTHTTFVVLSTQKNAPILYSGNSITELTQKIQTDFSPTDGSIPPENALRRARQLVGNQGSVIYLTDHSQALPDQQDYLFSVGEQKDNVAIVSLDFKDKSTWEALIVNYSPTIQTREWWLELPENKKSNPISFSLKPNEIKTITSTLQDERAILKITPDALPLDDEIPFLRPKKKPLLFHVELPNPEIWQKGILKLIPESTHIENKQLADFSISYTDNIFPKNSILSVKSPNSKPISGPFLPEIHPLTKNLNWQGLLLIPAAIPLPEKFTPILWKDDSPIISWNSKQNTLLLHFDIANSNFFQIPAGALLIHRFAEIIRKNKPSHEAQNFILGQTLYLPASQNQELLYTISDQNKKTLSSSAIKPSEIPLLKAPTKPGFFAISPLLDGAAHFSDPVESNLLNCHPKPLLPLKKNALEIHSARFHFEFLCLIFACLCLFFAWKKPTSSSLN